MARRVYFAFHYQRDIWRVNQVRKSNVIKGFESAEFIDSSLCREKWGSKGKTGIRS